MEDIKKIAGVILAGGRNSRMDGEKKLFLEYKGELFYQLIAKALGPSGKIFLSVDHKEPYENLGFPLILDQYSSIGPMGGIYTSLKECREEALLVFSCDIPLVEKRLAEELLMQFYKTENPVFAQTAKRVHPLVGIYTKPMLLPMEKMIESGDFRMMNLLDQVKHDLVTGEGFENMLKNINTKEDYESLKCRTCSSNKGVCAPLDAKLLTGKMQSRNEE